MKKSEANKTNETKDEDKSRLLAKIAGGVASTALALAACSGTDASTEEQHPSTTPTTIELETTSTMPTTDAPTSSTFPPPEIGDGPIYVYPEDVTSDK